MRYCYLPTAIGNLLLAGDGHGLRRIEFEKNGRPAQPAGDWTEDRAALAPVVDQLEEYFDGERRHFDLKLAPSGTPFQLSVWAALADIPFGETLSYGELARRIGNPNASRAVGAANGKNPLPLVLPCHRVIGSSGSLTGFGGGIDVKRALLDHEQSVVGVGAGTLF